MKFKHASCGEARGYRRHQKLKEEPCLECRAAYATYQRDYRRRTRKQPVRRAEERMVARARQQALVLLSRRHQGEFQMLRMQVMARLRLDQDLEESA